MSTASLLIVDDHPVVRNGIKSLLSNYPEFDVVAEAGSRREAIAAFCASHPDVVLLDIRLGDDSGLEVLDELLDLDPGARVLMLSAFDDDEYLRRSLRTGALGYVLKGESDSVLVTAIETVAAGGRALGPQMTDRVVAQLYGGSPLDTSAGSELSVTPEDLDLDDVDIEILTALAEGASNPTIAQRLCISDSTVKRRIRVIFERLGVSRRPEAVAEAVRRGIV